MSINDLPFGSADVSHEGRDQNNIPLETQGSSNKELSYVTSFIWIFLFEIVKTIRFNRILL